MAGNPLQQAAMGYRGMPGIGGYLPQQNNMMDILARLGVPSEQLKPFQDMNLMPKQMSQALSLKSRLMPKTAGGQTIPTPEQFMSDPQEKLDFFMTIWRNLNSYLRSQGGQEIPVWEFAQQATPDVQQMIQMVFPDMGQQNTGAGVDMSNYG